MNSTDRKNRDRIVSLLKNGPTDGPSLRDLVGMARIPFYKLMADLKHAGVIASREERKEIEDVTVTLHIYSLV